MDGSTKTREPEAYGGRITPDLVTLDDVLAARERIGDRLRRTPTWRAESLSRMCGRPVHLKAEHLQRTGSFKPRGALNLLTSLGPEVTEVVAASAGNHAQGVALAAGLTGRHATVFMPVTASLPKVQATRDYGADVLLAGETVDDAIALAKDRAGDHGGLLRQSLRPPTGHRRAGHGGAGDRRGHPRRHDRARPGRRRRADLRCRRRPAPPGAGDEGRGRAGRGGRLPDALHGRRATPSRWTGSPPSPTASPSSPRRP